MAIALELIGGVSAYSISANANSGIESFTLPSVSNGILIATFSIFDGTLANRTVTTPTWNGSNTIKLRGDEISGAGGQRVEIWYILSPTSGAHTFNWSTGGGTPFVDLGIRLFSGVDQTNPFDSPAIHNVSTHTGVTSETLSLTTLTDNSWIVDVCEAANGPQSAGGSQTRDWDKSGSTSSGSHRGPLSPAGAYSTSYSTVAADNFVLASLALKPSAAAVGATVKPLASLGVG